MEIDHSNSQFIKNGITFSVSLVFGFALFSLFAPAFRSHAEDKSTQELSAEVNPVVSVSAPEELNFTITPTSSGSFDSKELRVNVSTNAIKGYELYFSSEDEQTNMKHTSPSVSNTISSAFTGSLTSANMQKNTWGYSLNNTDFKSIPTKSHQVKLKDLKSYPTPAERVQSVYFGVKADTTLPSGSYEKNVVFTALAHANPLIKKVGILKLKTMQQMTSHACGENTIPNSTARQIDTDGSHHGDPNYIPTVTLTDTRDNNTYTVSRLADGLCWMTQNLRIVGKTITSDDSDVENDYTIPPSVDEYTNFDELDKSGAYLDNTYGAYYTWTAATAGTGNSTLPANHNTSDSICPRGWKLPGSYNNTGSYYGIEFSRLVDIYPPDETGLSPLAAAPFNFTNASGYIANGITSQDSTSGWWSSTVSGSGGSYDLQNSGSVFNPTDVTTQYRGLHVRCVNIIPR